MYEPRTFYVVDGFMVSPEDARRTFERRMRDNFEACRYCLRHGRTDNSAAHYARLAARYGKRILTLDSLARRAAAHAAR